MTSARQIGGACSAGSRAAATIGLGDPFVAGVLLSGCPYEVSSTRP
jgi:hypothetical protein